MEYLIPIVIIAVAAVLYIRNRRKKALAAQISNRGNGGSKPDTNTEQK